MGLGGLPDDLSVEALVVRGPTGPVLVDCADDPDDLLVIGTGRRGLRRVAGRSVSRYCVAHARCPVVAVPPSALMEEANHGLHLWPRKQRLPALITPRRGFADAGAKTRGALGLRLPDSGPPSRAFS